MKQCPRCNKKFSNEIKFCPVCGYVDNKDSIQRDEHNNIRGFTVCPRCHTEYAYLKEYCNNCGYSTETYKDRMQKLQEDVDKPSKQKNIPRCPTCGSTDIKKISTTRKVVGAIGFGLLSKTAKSQFECKDCGYKW